MAASWQFFLKSNFKVSMARDAKITKKHGWKARK